LSATKISANDNIRTLKPLERKCYFQEETILLKTHKTYSQSSCMLECSLKFARDSLKLQLSLNQSCMPWFFPSEEDHITMCNPWQSVHFMKYFTSIPQDKCNQCLPGNTKFCFSCLVSSLTKGRLNME
jgi:hypothetical protein